MKQIQAHINKIKSLCERHKVAEMYAFGSVLTDKFTSNRDIDFLVKFSGVNPLEYFDNYMDLKEALERLFDRDVDLVEVQTLKNPVLKQSISRKKILIYGRENTEVAI